MYVTLLILYNFLNLFSCILTVFLGLFVVSAAHVQISLESRAKIKEINDGRKTWTKDDIYQSILQAKELDDAGFKYPRPFYNRDARQNPIFEAKGPFKEFPLTTPVWTNGMDCGRLRVIVKENWDYVGVTEKDPGCGGTVHACC